MLKLYSLIRNSSNYSQTLYVQLALYVTVLFGVVLHFDFTLLLLGLILGWLLFCFGVSISLHKFISHRSFDARNRFVKLLLLWLGTQTTLGSPVGFAAGHRQHHLDSDGDTDPFKLENNMWHNIKLWFYRFPLTTISPRLVKDLSKDSDFKFFHKNYWKIWAVLPTLILITSPVYFVYFFAIPVVYCFVGMSYVTVVAHSKTWQKLFKGTNEFNELDDSWDSNFFTYLFAGEGYHHTHHVDPTQYDYSKTNNRFDFSGFVIEKLLKN